MEAPSAGIGPELTITYFDAVTGGGVVTYQMEVANAGDATAHNFWVDLHIDTDGPALCEEGDLYAFVETLAPGEKAAFEAEVEGSPSGWSSAFVVDSCDDVAESNEGNNIAWVTP